MLLLLLLIVLLKIMGSNIRFIEIFVDFYVYMCTLMNHEFEVYILAGLKNSR